MSKYNMKRKSEYKQCFQGSTRLFNACWNAYRRGLHLGLDWPVSDLHVNMMVYQLASQRVNNPRSTFYLHGE